ncbi:MAG: carboxypeptidase regulatory-like domain-containing protein [Nitrospiria bacterium]
MGTPPLRKSVAVKVDPNVCGLTFQEESFVNPGNKGVKNAVISLKNKSTVVSPLYPPGTVDITSKNCRLEPHVAMDHFQEPFKIKNFDPVLHVLQFSRKDHVLFNLPLPPDGNIIRKINDESGLIQVKCLIHPFMKAIIAVMDTPYYVLSDHEGSFQVPEIEAGKYLLSIWHESFGSLEKEIEIVPGRTLNLSFEFKKG